MAEIINNSRIAKNTVYLYIRMFFTMAVGLYTSRVVLQVLGISDYGLYNVIGGIVTLFTAITAALTIGTQRFLNFAIGEGDFEKLERTFSIALGLHFFIAILILLLGETIGLWFLNNHINIPEGREFAAQCVYQFTIFNFIISIIQIPFQSCIIAHEKMNIYAYMSIYDVIMKLLVVMSMRFINFDKLILYAFLLFVVQVTSVFIYNAYCRKKIVECTFKIVRDLTLTKEIISYSGWNLLGGAAVIFTNQALTILLNVFSGTIINAARGLALTVNSYINTFVNNFQTAANPQIVKLYASREYEQLYKLVINNSRIASYLYLIVAIPAWIEIKFVLTLWLGDYPEITENFIRIILIQSLFTTINQPLQMLIHASGKMKTINIVNSLVLALSFPLSYIFLKLGYAPNTVFWINAICFAASWVVCLFFSQRYTGLSIKRMVRDVYINIILGLSIMFAIPYFISRQLNEGWNSFLIVSSISLITSFVVIYFWGFTKGMRKMIIDKIKRK